MRAVRLLEVLIEDQVPDLHDAPAAVLRATLRVEAPRGQLPQEVDVDLGAGAAGAAAPGGAPEVLPAPVRLLVEGPHALRRARRWRSRGPPNSSSGGSPSSPAQVVAHTRSRADPQVLGDELVAVGDRLGLEVAPFGGAPEGEVAQHLEERVVGVVPHLLDVRGAHAALDGDHAPGGGAGGVEVEGLELLHPGAVQEDAGVALHHQGGCRGGAGAPGPRNSETKRRRTSSLRMESPL